MCDVAEFTKQQRRWWMEKRMRGGDPLALQQHKFRRLFLDEHVAEESFVQLPQL